MHRSTTAPHREQYSDPERPILRIADGAIDRWQTGGWQRYIDSADQLGVDDAVHLGAPTVPMGLQPDAQRPAVDGHPRRHVHDAAGNPGRVAA